MVTLLVKNMMVFLRENSRSEEHGVRVVSSMVLVVLVLFRIHSLHFIMFLEGQNNNKERFDQYLLSCSFGRV